MNDDFHKGLDQETIDKIKNIPIGYSNFRIYFYFWLGVVSAVLLRAVKLFTVSAPIFAKAGWYIAVIGYTFFFLHRYNVSMRRKKAISKLGLLQKIQNKEKLDIVDYEALNYVLWSLSISKEKMNYIIILIFSAVAVVIALLQDTGILFQ